jgi:hypothetical protein
VDGFQLITVLIQWINGAAGRCRQDLLAQEGRPFRQVEHERKADCLGGSEMLRIRASVCRSIPDSTPD